MKNFKEIAEKCLAGELSGTFVLRNGKVFHSKTHLSATSLYVLPYCIAGWCYSVVGNCYSKSLSIRDNDVIDFIPDNMMQKKIEIDIPEGKVPVMEQTGNGVVITWKEKELTYNDIVEILQKDFHNNYIENLLSLGGFAATLDPNSSDTNIFYKKVKVLLKLVNIRNYFGKPDSTRCGYYIYEAAKGGFQVAPIAFPGIYTNSVVTFKEKEHAEQAIKTLGDELKYLFESW